MRVALVAVLCLAVGSPLYSGSGGQNPARERSQKARLAARTAADAAVDLRITIHPPGSSRAAHALAQARSALKRAGRGGMGASAVVDNSSTRIVLIPVVGRAQGAGGTFFRSDITFANWNEDDQRVEFIYLPTGNPGGTIIAEGTLPGDRPPFTIADFVGTQLNSSGVGSLLIFPIVPGGDFDPDAAFDVHSRIYTPQPNTTRGTVSQQFPGVDPFHLFGEYEAVILGLRQDADYRTNFGIVNLNDVAIEFSVLVLPESAPAGTQLTEVRVNVPALSMVHQALPPVSPGPFNLIIGIEQDIANDEQVWTTYAGSVDNTTGDGWVSIGATILDDDDLDFR